MRLDERDALVLRCASTFVATKDLGDRLDRLVGRLAGSLRAVFEWRPPGWGELGWGVNHI